MSDSKRLQVKKALVEVIKTTQGYDLSNSVYRGRSRVGRETDAPCVLLFDLIPDEEGSRTDQANSKNVWLVGLKGYITVSERDLTDSCDNFMAAVLNSLSVVMDNGGQFSAPDEYMLGGLITDLRVDLGATYTTEETNDRCAFSSKLIIEISEKIGEL